MWARTRTRPAIGRLLAPLVALAAIALGALPGAASAAETTTEATNNLAFPVIWSDGVTLPLNGTFGSPVFDGATATTADGTTVWVQGDPLNVWQAASATATEPVNVSQVDWGDNLESKSWNIGQPVRVEVTLLENLTAPMTAFTMLSAGGTKNAEVFGATQATYDSSQADVYSGCARLTIQRLDISRTDPYLSQLTWDPALGQWVGPPHMIAAPIVNSGVWDAAGEGSFSSEINAPGNVIYGYNWQTSNLTAGDYRLTFSLDPNCPVATLNTFLTSETTVLTSTETETTTESAVTAAASSGSGSSGGGGTAVIDSTDNLSYMDVELGSPTYAAYVPVPANTVPPAISGSAVQGQTLSATTGTWENSPTGYAYQWQDCDASGALCGDITGATGASYTLTGADLGQAVRVVVTATNQTGSASAPSALSSVVVSPPSATAQPQGQQQQRKTARITLQLHWLSATRARLTGSVEPRRDGQRLTIQLRTRTGWRTVATTGLRKQTTQRSQYTVTLSLAAGVYRAFMSGNATYMDSASKLMTVRGLVRLTVHVRRLDRHHVRLWGTAVPRHDGQRLMVQLRNGNRWRTVASVRLRRGAGTSSQFSVTLTNPRAGSYRLYLGGDRAHRASTSRTFRAG